MEHPTGQYATAVDAMEDAVLRLRALEKWDQWITFCAQEEGTSPDSIHFAGVRLLSDILETDTELNASELCAKAKVAGSALVEAGRNRYSITSATAKEAAQIMDAIFRGPLAMRPFADEDGDYAVGAEW